MVGWIVVLKFRFLSFLWGKFIFLILLLRIQRQFKILVIQLINTTFVNILMLVLILGMIAYIHEIILKLHFNNIICLYWLYHWILKDFPHFLFWDEVVGGIGGSCFAGGVAAAFTGVAVAARSWFINFFDDGILIEFQKCFVIFAF